MVGNAGLCVKRVNLDICACFDGIKQGDRLPLIEFFVEHSMMAGATIVKSA